MDNVLDILKERGFFQQCTDEEGLRKLLSEESVVFYSGFDPTADSLHVGHLMPVMAMAHLQKAGHRPIALLGGGTTMVGDPTGKTEMRKLLTREQIEENAKPIGAQIGRFVDFASGAAMVNNADWLLKLNYIEFLRDIGRHFRVNEMIKAETYKMRLEREDGLSFIEFNYQILQAYDFHWLHANHGCKLQIGGDDQWSNILAGIDLTRRLDGKVVYGLTFPLLTTARGEKMGKTVGGAVWLDPQKTSPYEYYQYWINTDDKDVERFLAFFTLLPMDEVRRLGALEGADIRQAKEVLAFETTRLVHGQEEAEKAQQASKAAFGGGGDDFDSMPTSSISGARLTEGVSVVDIFVEVGLTRSKSESRRLITQGGAYVEGVQITAADATLDTSLAKDGALMLRAGKKKYHRLVIEC